MSRLEMAPFLSSSAQDTCIRLRLVDTALQKGIHRKHPSGDGALPMLCARPASFARSLGICLRIVINAHWRSPTATCVCCPHRSVASGVPNPCQHHRRRTWSSKRMPIPVLSGTKAEERLPLWLRCMKIRATFFVCRRDAII